MAQFFLTIKQRHRIVCLHATNAERFYEPIDRIISEAAEKSLEIWEIRCLVYRLLRQKHHKTACVLVVEWIRQ